MDTQISISVTDALPDTVRVNDVNCHLTCPVCNGYLIDATTITECLHSFCRSCVVAHVSEHHTCPSCSVPLSTTKPFSQLRSDYTLQTIVYKMVPRLARAELERRQKFAQRHPDTTANDERYLESFIAPDDPISLSLEYAEPNCAFGLRRFGVTDERDEGDEHGRRRYFRCPANLPVGHLIKFLRCKFNVIDASKHKLEILYNGHPLAPEYKLADVAYIFSWKENEPLRLWYRISSTSAAESATAPIVSTVATPTKAAKRIRKIKKKPLVDITCERQSERPAKRRKRTAPADAPPPPPPTPVDEDDVKLSTLLPSKTAAVAAPTGDSAAEINRPKTEDNNNKANAIFDRATEFSCSTPIPEKEGELKAKSTNWLPKAVFDLDDRDLFAKRLQKITESKPEAAKDAKPEAQGKDAPASPSSPLNPLRICVTPEPPSAASEEGANEAVHDSIGALDLSGSSKSETETAQPSPGTSTIKSPHPYFMTPMFPDPARSSPAALSAPSPNKMQIKKPPAKFSPPPPTTTTSTASTGTNASPNASPMLKSPLWNLINHMPPLMPLNHDEAAKMQQRHRALFDIFNSNPFLFRPTNAQKSPISKVNAPGKLPSPNSI